jgi:hypothetical protein
MNIQPKTVVQTNTIQISYNITKLNDIHVTNDDPYRKILRVNLMEAMPPQIITFTGADYDALGQWTDDALNSGIMAKLGLAPATGSES